MTLTDYDFRTPRSHAINTNFTPQSRPRTPSFEPRTWQILFAGYVADMCNSSRTPGSSGEPDVQKRRNRDSGGRPGSGSGEGERGNHGWKRRLGSGQRWGDLSHHRSSPHPHANLDGLTRETSLVKWVTALRNQLVGWVTCGGGFRTILVEQPTTALRPGKITSDHSKVDSVVQSVAFKKSTCEETMRVSSVMSTADVSADRGARAVMKLSLRRASRAKSTSCRTHHITYRRCNSAQKSQTNFQDSSYLDSTTLCMTPRHESSQRMASTKGDPVYH